MAVAFDASIRKPLLTLVPAWIHPNHLSIIRALMAFPVIILRRRPFWSVSLLILSSVLDILDGPLARVRKQSSQLGAWLDAYSDKIFVLSTLYFACEDRVTIFVKLTITALEVILAGMRPLKRWLGAKADSNRWGALKTWSQSFAIAFVLTTNELLQTLSVYVFYLAISFACLSLFFHVRDIWKR